MDYPLLNESEQADVLQGINFWRTDGTASKMRSHKGNMPVLPQNKPCPFCSACFTRTTHLNRHIRTHTNERSHRCDACDAQFTRSDLLTRHKKTCTPENSQRSRRKACVGCTDSKVKCDRQVPCSRCQARGRECVVTSNAQQLPVLPLPSFAFDSIPQAGPSNPHLNLLNPMPAPLDPISTSLNPITITTSMDSIATSLNEGSDSLAPISNSSIYSNSFNGQQTVQNGANLFEPLLSNVFTLPTTASIASNDGSGRTEYGGQLPRLFSSFVMPGGESEFGLPTLSNLGNLPLHAATAFVNTGMSLQPKISELPSTSAWEPSPGEVDRYMHLFFTKFVFQLPVFHVASFNAGLTPPLLLNAMQACGALFLKNKRASFFVTKTLADTRELMVQEFMKEMPGADDKINLVLAVAMLQTIGLFHQLSDQRASSNVFHVMLVMMIRSSGLIQENAAWVPPLVDPAAPDQAWREWARHEMAKRALLWSFMHDCAHQTYFAIPSSYHPGEVILHLPCDADLWTAPTANDWLRILQNASPTGTLYIRLAGHPMGPLFNKLEQPQVDPRELPVLNRFALFILNRSILSRLLGTCVEGRLQKATSAVEEEATRKRLMKLQFAMHHWLHLWDMGIEAPAQQNERPTFINNSIPFYWLAQLAILAYQEGLPPFECGSASNLKIEERFWLVKSWLRHISAFLEHADPKSTLIWDELMRIRLQAMHQDSTPRVNDGILEFFPGFSVQ